MIEGVVKVGAYLQPRRLRKLKEFMKPQVHAPRAGSGKNVSSGNVRIIEGISSNRRWQKCRRIEELIPDLDVLARARDYERSEARLIEPDCVDEPWLPAKPGRSCHRSRTAKPVPLWRNYSERKPPGSVGPRRKIAPKLPPCPTVVRKYRRTSRWRETNESREVVIGIKLVVDAACFARYRNHRLLVQ